MPIIVNFIIIAAFPVKLTVVNLTFLDQLNCQIITKIVKFIYLIMLQDFKFSCSITYSMI